MATASAVNIKPLADRVVVRPLDEAEQQTKGGIIVPDTAKEKPQQGEVTVGGEEYLILRETDVLAVVG